MKRIDDIKTTTYMDGDYIIDIVKNGDSREAYISHRNYGIKMLMFGELNELDNWKEFKDLIEANLDDYKRLYHREYEK